MKPFSLLRVIATAALAAGLFPALWAQSSQPTAPAQRPAEKPKPKARKVWTNDDLAALRRPGEVTEPQKSAESVEHEKTAQTARPGQAAEPDGVNDFVPPRSVEEAEVRLHDKRLEVASAAEAIRQLRLEYFAAQDDMTRGLLRRRVERLARDHAAAEQEMKKLEAALAELKPKGSASQAAPPPRP